MSGIIVFLERVSTNGSWSGLFLTLKYGDGYGDEIAKFGIYNSSNIIEDEAVSTILDDFEAILNLGNFRSTILKGFRRLRESDLNGHSLQTIKIPAVSKELREPHFSCKTNQNEDDTSQFSGENIISHSEVQQKLGTVDKDNNVILFFQDNKCSVCLSSYKEILDDELHIVIPSCGHPLCCQCADNILMCTKKECPRCRGSITADSFNLMKFNADVEMDNQDKRVYL